MKTFWEWIDWGEHGILRWARALVVSVFGLLIIIGAIVLLTSLLRLGVWPSVTADDDLASIRFSAPDISEQGESPPLRIRSLQSQVRDAQRYRDDVNEMLEHLTPLYVSLGSSIGRQDLEKYINNVIDSLISNMATNLPSSTREQRLERLDAAVEDMTDYVEDMVDYYTEALEEDLRLRGNFQRNIARSPLKEYEEQFTKAITELVQQSDAEQSRVMVARAKGLAGFGTLGIIGILILSGIPLLVILRIDAILRERQENPSGD